MSKDYCPHGIISRIQCYVCSAVDEASKNTFADPITSQDWQALCNTSRPNHPEHWAFVHLACTINHLSAALLMAGIDPNQHNYEDTIPNENGANLREVFCAWKAAQRMIKEIGRKAAESGSPLVGAAEKA